MSRYSAQVQVAKRYMPAGVSCDCGWNNGDHEGRCALGRAWDDAMDRAAEDLDAADTATEES